MKAEPWLKSNLICLQHAVLCANCEIISEPHNGRCSACGSEAVLSLSNVLGGPLRSDSAPNFCRATPDDDMLSERYLSAAAESYPMRWVSTEGLTHPEFLEALSRRELHGV
jgi:hypothetical protein